MDWKRDFAMGLIRSAESLSPGAVEEASRCDVEGKVMAAVMATMDRLGVSHCAECPQTVGVFRKRGAKGLCWECFKKFNDDGGNGE